MAQMVLFDLNGVCIRSTNLGDRFEERFGVRAEEFSIILQELLKRTCVPNAGDAFAYWKPYFDSWGVTISRDDFFHFWFEGEYEVSETIEVLKELKKRNIRVFAISNNFAERASFYKGHMKILEYFEKVYYSFETGFLKPDKNAYINVLNDIGVSAEQFVYFDNKIENVDSAKGLGMNAYVFEGAEKAITQIKDNKIV